MPTVTPIAAFTDNYIWLVRDNQNAVVVDPGEAEPVLDYCEREGLTLTAILITHHHGDHVGGVKALLAQFPETTVYGPADESIPKRTVAVGEGVIVDLPSVSLQLKVMAIPGHTLGHIAYYDNQRVFCGDTLFAGGCGRLFEGSPLQMHQSLSRLAELPDATDVYCAHEYTLKNLAFARQVEPDNALLTQRQQAVQAMRTRQQPSLPSTIGQELATNPFLRCDHEAVVAAASAHRGHTVAPGVETFAALRRWKDNA